MVDFAEQISTEIERMQRQAAVERRSGQVKHARFYRLRAEYLRTFLDGGGESLRDWLDALATVIGDDRSDRYARDGLLAMVDERQLPVYVPVYKRIMGIETEDVERIEDAADEARARAAECAAAGRDASIHERRAAALDAVLDGHR